MKIKAISILASLFFCAIVSPLLAQRSVIVINGQVLVGETADPLPGAVIYSPSLLDGCVADENGNYEFRLQKYSAIVVARYVGCSNDTLQIRSPKDQGGVSDILWNPKLPELYYDGDLIITDPPPDPIVPAPKRKARQDTHRQR